MATLWITQYAGLSEGSRLPLGREPNLGTLKVTAIDATNHVSTTIDAKTTHIGLYADAQMAISIGTAPDATADPIAFPIGIGHRIVGLAGVLVRPGTLKVAAATV